MDTEKSQYEVTVIPKQPAENRVTEMFLVSARSEIQALAELYGAMNREGYNTNLYTVAEIEKTNG
jgi:hypothetical protein